MLTLGEVCNTSLMTVFVIKELLSCDMYVCWLLFLEDKVAHSTDVGICVKSKKLNDVASQKTAVFIVTALRMSFHIFIIVLLCVIKK
jgi:hypothetical protein